MITSHTVLSHLLPLAQPQEANPETLELQEDVVHGGVGVAGQQHTEPTSVEDANLKEERSGERFKSWLYIMQI